MCKNVMMMCKKSLMKKQFAIQEAINKLYRTTTKYK